MCIVDENSNHRYKMDFNKFMANINQVLKTASPAAVSQPANAIIGGAPTAGGYY
jgi:hypothetical protein